MRIFAATVVSAALLLAGCATSAPPSSAPPAFLFADHLFGPPSERVERGDIFAVSDEMRTYVLNEMGPLKRKLGVQHALVEALYKRGELQLEYESTRTRNAAEAFEARAGNCLSLIIMTAAFAKEMGMTVQFQSAYLEETWSRKGNLLLLSGHVNVTLGTRLGDHWKSPIGSNLTIDFLPSRELLGMRTRAIPESLVVAMFLNNRAVEALVGDRFDDAYAWAREAVRADPDYLAAQNTLGVIYLRRGALAEADAVFSHVLMRAPEHTRALANLAEVRTRQGRTQDAAQLSARLAKLEPEPPLHYFNQGLAAIRHGDFRSARDLLAREAARGDTTADVHFWLGVVHYRLGDVDQAAREMSLAAEASASRTERELYSAKLDWLRARAVR